jgi:hypothetical protein
MLKRASREQSETFEALRLIFLRAGVQFMLVGGAACREHGLSRPAKDLDIVLQPYSEAIRALAGSKRFDEGLGNPDWTQRTSTYFDARTGVTIDFLTAGIRINNGSATNSHVIDIVPIPYPVGELAPPQTLIAMKLSAVISGEILESLNIPGGRSAHDIVQDVSDVRELIVACDLESSIPIGPGPVQQRYHQLWEDVISDR